MEIGRHLHDSPSPVLDLGVDGFLPAPPGSAAVGAGCPWARPALPLTPVEVNLDARLVGEGGFQPGVDVEPAVEVGAARGDDEQQSRQHHQRQVFHDRDPFWFFPLRTGPSPARLIRTSSWDARSTPSGPSRPYRIWGTDSQPSEPLDD